MTLVLRWKRIGHQVASNPSCQEERQPLSQTVCLLTQASVPEETLQGHSLKFKNVPSFLEIRLFVFASSRLT
ncbi:hypothetical protein DNTS_026562 [Danionella cerebrum]|uniref:Uncharacterized protein n=1 Tax=Danionella cerebrum TaxID=2873325 RepID=A0A553NH23_9TELE|nr:hypothetical protein DNTS_026562 [Danionella translucida]